MARDSQHSVHLFPGAMNVSPPAHLLAKRMVQFNNVSPIRIPFCLLVDENYQEKEGKGSSQLKFPKDQDCETLRDVQKAEARALQLWGRSVDGGKRRVGCGQRGAEHKMSPAPESAFPQQPGNLILGQGRRWKCSSPTISPMMGAVPACPGLATSLPSPPPLQRDCVHAVSGILPIFIFG